MLLVRLARSCHRYRWLVVAGWLAVVVAGAVAAPALFGRLTAQVGVVDASESAQAGRALFDAAPSGAEVVALVDGRSASDPGLRDSVAEVARQVRAVDGVEAVTDPWSTGDPRLVADDGGAVVVAVQFVPFEATDEALDEVAALLRSVDAPEVVVGGGALQDREMDAQAAEDLKNAELLSLPVVLVLLLVLFGGVVAAGLPVVVALVGVAGTLATLYAVSLLMDVSVYSVNIVTMLGLGLAVDYALLLVGRFREERAVDPDVLGALERTLATAGRTVAFSGLTVAASLGGLLVFSDDFLRSMGAAGLAVVLLDLLAALTLLPALLALVGRRIRPAAPRTDGRGVFVRTSRFATRRPLLLTVVASTVLLLAATPFLGARFAQPDARSLPADSASRQLAEAVQERFGRAADADPVTVVLDGAVAAAALERYVGAVEALPGAARVTVREDVPGLTVVDVVPDGTGTGLDDTARRLVADLRGLDAPADARVTGDAAYLVDYQDALVDRLPWALLVIGVATALLLFAFTGSVVVPVKAIVMSTLSLGASYGALVWVFQDGSLGALVGTEALGALSITTPVIVFAVAFGLSMDYEVFLLGRIAELHRETGDSDLAVEQGLQRTGRIVTSAALLLVVVFAGFVAGGFSPIKQVGLGLVLAVVVDVTVVRMLLLPAVMRLMGERNWWAPAPLRRLHDRFGLTEAPAVMVPSQPQAGQDRSVPAGRTAPAPALVLADRDR